MSVADSVLESAPPRSLEVRRRSAVVEIIFADGAGFALPFEYLRVYSPSAEVRGHGGDIPPPVAGKRAVLVTSAEAVGNYAVKFVFSDGHDSGIYSWRYLREMGENREQWWARYLERLSAAGGKRFDDAPSSAEKEDK